MRNMLVQVKMFEKVLSKGNYNQRNKFSFSLKVSISDNAIIKEFVIGRKRISKN